MLICPVQSINLELQLHLRSLLPTFKCPVVTVKCLSMTFKSSVVTLNILWRQFFYAGVQRTEVVLLRLSSDQAPFVFVKKTSIRAGAQSYKYARVLQFPLQSTDTKSFMYEKLAA